MKLLIFAPLVLYPLLTALLSLFLTRQSFYWLRRFGSMAKVTGGRHIHTREVPRGGGIGMALAYIIVLFLLRFTPNCPLVPYTFKLAVNNNLALPLLILLPLGLIDDKRGVNALIKLLVQCLAAVLCWSLGGRLTSIWGFDLPAWLSLLTTVFWIVGSINAFNLIDGLDGLAAGVSIISSCSLGIVLLSQGSYQAALPMFCLAGACLGFLRYNLHPAQMFMGDTGSMFIGYTIGVLGIITSTKLATVPAVLIPILASGVPILDTFLAIWRRLTYKMLHWNDKSVGIMKADRLHLHHRLLERFGNDQARTVHLIYAIAVVFAAVCILCTVVPRHLPWLAFTAALAAFSLVIHRLAVIELWNSSELFVGRFALGRTGVVINLLHPIWDLLVIFLSFAFAGSFFGYDTRHGYTLMFFWIAPVFIMLMLSRNYQIFWNHAIMEDFFHLIGYLVLGFLLTLGVSRVFSIVPAGNSRLYMMAFSFSMCGIIGERLAIFWVRYAMLRCRGRRGNLSPGAIKNVIIYGLSPESRLYARRMVYGCGALQERLVGFLDRDTIFHSGYCNGLRVYGDLTALEQVKEKTGFSKLVICKHDLAWSELQRIRDFCHEHAVECVAFRCEELEPDEHCLRTSGQEDATEDAGDLQP